MKKISSKTVIDVRNPAEFKKGNAKGSINIPIEQIESHFDQLRKTEGELILVCGGGTRNIKAVQILKNEGINSIAGGSWKNH